MEGKGYDGKLAQDPDQKLRFLNSGSSALFCNITFGKEKYGEGGENKC